MAFLLPENIPSRPGVPDRLRHVARAFRDSVDDQVTVWLRETDGGYPYLVVLAPALGIMVIDAPSLSARTRARRGQGRVCDSFDMIRITDKVGKQAEELRARAGATNIESLPVECVLAVPDHDEIPLDRLGESDRALPMLARADLSAERLEDAVRRIFGGDQHPPLSANEVKRARAVVNPQIVLPQSRSENLPLFQEPGIPPEDVIRVMDRAQERAAEHLGSGYRVLRGVAGSGKTLVLAHRARYVHKHWPNWRILLLCYNRILAEALKMMVEADDRLEVTNVDRLAYRLAGADANKATGDFDARVRSAIATAKCLPDSERFDLVLVDEAQDFDHARLNLAYALLKSDRMKPNPAQPDRDNFVMAYDVAQNVYGRGGARWSPPGVDAKGRSRTARGRSTIFRMNYRNTREILEFAMNFLAGSRDWKSEKVDMDDPAALIPPEDARRSGPAVRQTIHGDLRTEAEAIASRVKGRLADGDSPHEIVVFYGTPELQKKLYGSFKRLDLPYFHVQQHHTKNRDQAVHVRDKVRVSTLTGMKGLEFSRVFIGGVNQLRVRDVAEEDQFKAATSHLYAAMTRATDELMITMSGDGKIGRALLEAERLQRGG